MSEYKILWEERVRRHRIYFELAGYAITTVTWVSFCFVSSFMVVQGYQTPSPAFDSMGWSGIVLYGALAGGFVLISLITSLVLLGSLWSLMTALKSDIEFGSNRMAGMFVSIFGRFWNFLFVAFLFVLIANISFPILVALGRIEPFKLP